MSDKVLFQSKEIMDYMNQVGFEEPVSLQKLRHATLDQEKFTDQISAQQGQLLALLIQLTQSKIVLEVGVFMGYSTLWMAQALPKDGRLIACEKNPKWQDHCLDYWQHVGVADRIDYRLGHGLETIALLKQQEPRLKLDFVFVDANKLGYKRYFESLLSIMRPGGLMVFDNTLQQQRVVNLDCSDRITRSIKVFNQMVHQDERVDTLLLPLFDGVTLLRVK